MLVDLTTHAPNTVHLQQFTFYQETGSIKRMEKTTIFHCSQSLDSRYLGYKLV